MESAAAAIAGAGAADLASLMAGVLGRMLDRGAFVVSNELHMGAPLFFMTPSMLHALVAEEYTKAGLDFDADKAVEGVLKAAFGAALEPRGVRFHSKLRHGARGGKNGVFVNVRPACIPTSWSSTSTSACLLT